MRSREEDEEGPATWGHSADKAQVMEAETGVPLRSAECGAHRGHPPEDVREPQHRHFDVPALKTGFVE